MDAAAYEAWYQTPRGVWVSRHEFRLLHALINPKVGENLLDVGCGTGHFSRLFLRQGLHVTGLDPDYAMLDFACSQNTKSNYLPGSATQLPFADTSFDHCVAITSLCFIDRPEIAVREMWRVCRKTMTLGLLNRNSLLYREKYNQGAYRGARWDTLASVKLWLAALEPLPCTVRTGSAIFTGGHNSYQRFIESLIPRRLLYGAFLCISMSKTSNESKR